MITNSRYEEIILETIDQLRKRKARPDLDRITHMMERRHSIPTADTIIQLRRLVDEKVVIKVDYKGSTSYRNAAKWRRTRPLDVGIPRKMQTGLQDAFSTTGNGDIGSSLTDLGTYFMQNIDASEIADGHRMFMNMNNTTNGVSNNDSNIIQAGNTAFTQEDIKYMTLRKLSDLLQKEIESGNCRRLPNGNFMYVGNDLSPERSISSDDQDADIQVPVDLSTPKTTAGTKTQTAANIMTMPSQASMCTQSKLLNILQKGSSPKEITIPGDNAVSKGITLSEAIFKPKEMSPIISVKEISQAAASTNSVLATSSSINKPAQTAEKSRPTATLTVEKSVIKIISNENKIMTSECSSRLVAIHPQTSPAESTTKKAFENKLNIEVKASPGKRGRPPLNKSKKAVSTFTKKDQRKPQ